MIVIDGGAGEGGGQVLRTGLALSLVTGRPFRIERIRAGRERPGLLRQHLTCVRAAAEIGSGVVEGAELGSTELTFRPGAVRPGSYHFVVGTAGSTMLVLQSVLPALLVTEGVFEIEVEGGTHADHAPPFEFIALVLAPVLRAMGAQLDLVLHRAGFHPAGGGHVTLRVTGGRLRPVELLERGAVVRRSCRALVANLPHSVGEHERAVVKERLGWPEEDLSVEAVAGSIGPGNALLLTIECEHAAEVLSAFGSLGRSARSVAEGAVRQARSYLAASVPVGTHLADQLLVPLALAGGGCFRTLAPSRHATTNADVIRSFLDVDIAFTREDTSSAWRCDVRAAGQADA